MAGNQRQQRQGANTMAQGGAGEVTRGALGLNDELTNFRSNMIDQAKLVQKYRGQVGFLNVLLTSKLNKRDVSDTQFISFEQEEEDVLMTIGNVNTGGYTSGSLSVSADVLDLAIQNSHAAQLQSGWMLSNHSMDAAVSGTAVTYTVASSSFTVKKPEIAEVVEVGAADSATSGYTRVRIRRQKLVYSLSSSNHGGANYWVTGHVVLRGNQASADTEDTKLAVQINPSPIYSYLQDFRKPFGVSEREQNVDKFVVKDPLAWAGKKARWSFLREIERAITFDSVGGKVSSNGLEKTMTHSVNSIIPSANYLSLSSPTKNALDVKLGQFSQIGERVETRIILAGAGFLQQMNGLFSSYIYDADLFGDKKIGYTVPMYQDALGTPYYLIYSREMSVSSLFNNTGLVINTQYVKYAYWKGKERSFDMHVDMGPNGQGLQSNGAKKTIYQLRAVSGLDVNFYEAHGRLQFV